MIFHATAEAAIEAAKAECATQGLIDFDGQNCNDYLEEGRECGGWDGHDHRCECGNRRVYWETGGDAASGFYAFAAAN